jgi:microcystin-dependent protein
VTDPYLAELRIVSFAFAPRGWAFCNGQLLPINQNQALFSLLGTTYGGNGIQTFALPNLQGATGLHWGGNYSLGQVGGESAHQLSSAEMPTHTHTVHADSGAATVVSPAGAVWAASSPGSQYAAAGDTTMSSGAVGTAGSSQPHPNLPPYLVLNVIIALQGIFPSRN